MEQDGGGKYSYGGGLLRIPGLENFTGSWDDAMSYLGGQMRARNPTNHMGGSTPGWDEAFNLRRKQQAIANSPGMQSFFNAVNNPTPLEAVGRQGVSFQGMGQQGDAMQNQLALLLGRKP